MRSRRRRYNKNNIRSHGPADRRETVYVQSPCVTDSIDDNNRFNDVKKNNKTKKVHRPAGSFNLKKMFGNLFGKSGNDDLIIIILIVIFFLSRHSNGEDCDETSGEGNEFSVTDFMSKASDILNKFNDNDILLIALLYILL